IGPSGSRGTHAVALRGTEESIAREGKLHAARFRGKLSPEPPALVGPTYGFGQSDSLRRLLLFHRHGDIGVRRQPDLVALDVGDQVLVDEVMMAFVPSLAAIGLDQLDPPAF